MKRNLIALALFAVAATAAQADIIVLQTDGTVATQEAVSNVQKITFADGNVCVALTDGSTQTSAISATRKIYFSDDETGIQSIFGNTLSTAGRGTLRVVDAAGRVVLQRTLSADAADVSLDALPNGVYILSLNGKSTKILKR